MFTELHQYKHTKWEAGVSYRGPSWLMPTRLIGQPRASTGCWQWWMSLEVRAGWGESTPYGCHCSEQDSSESATGQSLTALWGYRVRICVHAFLTVYESWSKALVLNTTIPNSCVNKAGSDFECKGNWEVLLSLMAFVANHQNIMCS